MSIYCSLRAVSDTTIVRARAHGPALELTDFGEKCELYKEWDLLHALITDNERDPDRALCFLDCGQMEFGDYCAGATFFTADQVRSISAALGRVTSNTIRSRFDPKGYSHPQAACDELVGIFLRMKRFLRKLAGDGKGLMVTRA